MVRLLFTIFIVLGSYAHAEDRTQWRVSSSEGLDAVLFIGAMSGDKLQSEEYQDEIARFRPLLSEEEHAALNRIGDHYARPGNGLAGPRFAYYLAAAPDRSYKGLAVTLTEPASFIESLGLPFEDELKPLFQDFLIVYNALERIGFIEDWREKIAPIITEKLLDFETYLSAYDIIPLQECYLGRDLEKEIEVLLLHYNKPYGIRVLGQRFASYHGWSKDITLRTAVHEIFHPPYDDKNPNLIAATQRLRLDPLILNIIANTDTAFGYATFDSILDEDSTQALDMMVSRMLGIERDPSEFWRHQDNGMHLLAAAIFHAMNETDFSATGGIYEEWLIDALNSDVLSPTAIEWRARMVIGDDAVDKWKP